MHHAHANRWRIPGLLLWVSAIAAVVQAADRAAPAVAPPSAATSSKSLSISPSTAPCLPDHGGYFSARVNGSINAELNATGSALSCAGAIRPSGKGLRLRFRIVAPHQEAPLVLLFGVRDLREGDSGNALPVNVTLIREGKGEFFATQGDSRCTIDRLTQAPLQAVPFKQRAWRVEAHGFCTQPARALNGSGAVLLSRFDFVGRADFSDDDDLPETATVAQ